MILVGTFNYILLDLVLFDHNPLPYLIHYVLLSSIDLIESIWLKAIQETKMFNFITDRLF